MPAPAKTVPAGVTSFTVGYATTQDNIFEADETTTLTIGGSTVQVRSPMTMRYRP
ncbi:hypothetical protein NK318_11005 [Acinetobacter junii]|uniref:hypothetical protein n=1 Tax=Acinetobacter junii TaxID=40215 RepID=UPI0035FB08AE